MKYETPELDVVRYEIADILVTSGEEGCAQPSFDAEYCDGVNQAVSKPF